MRERVSNSAHDRKSVAAVGTETVNGEIGVEASGAVNPKAAHDGETGAVHDRKILVAPGDAHLPRGFQIRRANGLDGAHTAAHAIPEALRRLAPDPVAEQSPGLNQHVIRGDQEFAGREDGLSSSV